MGHITKAKQDKWLTILHSKITAISNRYKNTLYDLIDNSNTESLDQQKLINNGSCNTPKSEGSSIDLSQGDSLKNENV